MSNEPHPSVSQSSRAYGCMLGGALGDALSAPGPALRIGGTTQLALYSLDGLLDALEWANAGTGADVNACIWLAYLRWYRAQEGSLPPSAPAPQPRWIDGQEILQQRVAPDAVSLSGLTTGEMGTAFRPVNPEAKGSAPVSRSAAFGLVPHLEAVTVAKISSDAASLTHGHPAARQAAGLFSTLIHHLGAGNSLEEAAAKTVGAAREAEETAPELIGRLDAAVRLAPEQLLSPENLAGELGDGHAAEEALAVGLYAVLATAPAHDADRGAGGDESGLSPQEHFRSAMQVATGYGKAAPAVASIAGSILGARYGEECLPGDWLDRLEERNTIRALVDQLLKVTLA
ncbi:ADP-ribosylglycohydrolase family protein [Pseudarthrobacter sp. J75]|uniref:ADP-ribosylglycohydrolase family protein n=1 Tax=unclassified Pseudarthrobacter TaxID=2647000 RepID=UPI002E803A6C|nr:MULTISPECIES: ADP-ribosylglycohydrolase family protein [unclassified Pseudarthrobacter]MEE2521504.1 ADP-ribosylglycohydrolase family protein [Pseudarthrobacter sp. J47]MEE2528736.1 ADP-ribosylglycohydrolase family protein [Pseudarthrobacter sp. J75]